MLRLTAPAWLAGLAALAVPVVLHLWNRRPSRVVRLGSLAGLTGPPGPRAFGRRLDEIPLLLLRCGVLAAAVLGIAGPAVRRDAASRPADQVVLVLPSALGDSLQVFSHPLADSLRRAGGPLRLAAPGFPLLEEAPPEAPSGEGFPVWPLLADLADTVAPGTRIVVLGSPLAAELGATRPRVAVPVEFRELGRENWARDPGNPAEPAGQPLLANRPGTSQTLYLVVGSEFEDEAEVLEAAWSVAIEGVTGVAPAVRRNPEGFSGEGLSGAGTIIWLTGQSVSENAMIAVESGATLIEFPGPGGEIPGTGTASPVATAGLADGTLRQPIHQIQPATPGSPLLVDGAGRPVLTVEARGAGWHYRMGTRAHPGWSGLAAGADLPELALLTLRGAATGAASAPVAPSQAALATAAPVGAARPAAWTSLAPLAWALAALLLALERGVSFRRAAHQVGRR